MLLPYNVCCELHRRAAQLINYYTHPINVVAFAHFLIALAAFYSHQRLLRPADLAR